MPDKTKTNEDQTVLQLERHASVYIFAKLQKCIYMYNSLQVQLKWPLVVVKHQQLLFLFTQINYRADYQIIKTYLFSHGSLQMTLKHLP